MFQINLFYEQQEIQRAKDYDPVRLMIVGGALILLGIGLWAALLYFKMGGLRDDLAQNDAELKKKEKEKADLGQLTDLSKIQGQEMSLRKRIENRVFFATQLDILREIIPTNCQIKSLKVVRAIVVTKESKEIEDKKDPSKKVKVETEKSVPSLDMVVVLFTRGKARLNILQTRDSLEDLFHRNQRLSAWLRQVSNEDASANWNDVTRASQNIFEPKGGGPFEAEFTFKMSFAQKN